MIQRHRWQANNTAGRNPFMRLVQHRSNLATIQRVVEHASHRVGLGTLGTDLGELNKDFGAIQAPSQPVVKAFLPSSAQHVVMSAEIGSTLPDAAASEGDQAMPGSVVPAGKDLPQAAPVPHESPAATGMSFSTTPKPSPELPGDPQASDATWSRLQTIFRRHQEKDQAEAARAEAAHVEAAHAKETNAGTAQAAEPKTADQTQPDTSTPSTAQKKIEPQSPFQSSTIQAKASSPVSGAGDQNLLTESHTADEVEDVSTQKPSVLDPGTPIHQGTETPELRPTPTNLPGQSTDAPVQHMPDELTQPPMQDRPPDASSIPTHPHAISPEDSQDDRPTSLGLTHGAQERSGQVKNAAQEHPIQSYSAMPSLARGLEPAEGENLSDQDEFAQPGETSSLPLQAEPLQSAWPVQRRESPPNRVSPTQQAETAFPRRGSQATHIEAPTRQQEEPGFQEHATTEANIEEFVQTASSSQPTDSSASQSAIEIIPPLRPRPGQAPPAPALHPTTPESSSGDRPQETLSPDSGRAKPVDQAAPTGETHATPPWPDSMQLSDIQRQVEQMEPPQPTITSTDPVPDQHTQDNLPQDKPLLDEPLLDELVQGELVQGEVIHTEIGPLPGDLWQLIGQKPPGHVSAPEIGKRKSDQPKSRVPGQVDQATPPGEAPAVMRSKAEQIPPVTDAASESASLGTPDLQRQETDQPPETSSTTTGQEEPAQAQDRLDVNELARKVYAEIKRKLSLEWERSRRL